MGGFVYAALSHRVRLRGLQHGQKHNSARARIGLITEGVRAAAMTAVDRVNEAVTGRTAAGGFSSAAVSPSRRMVRTGRLVIVVVVYLQFPESGLVFFF